MISNHYYKNPREIEPVKNKTLQDKIIYAEVRCGMWLADGNEALEHGDKKKAEECYRKSQFWLDRYNKLTGRS